MHCISTLYMLEFIVMKYDPKVVVSTYIGIPFVCFVFKIKLFQFQFKKIDHKGSEKRLGDIFQRFIKSLSSCLIW